MHRLWGAALVAVALLGLTGSEASAQTSQLTVTGSLALPSPATINAYNTGYICAGSVVATVTVVTPSPNTSRTDAIYVHASGPVSGGAANKLSDFQWTTNAAGCTATTGWTGLTQTKAFVAQGTASGNGTTVVSARIYFRMVLAWGTDAGNSSLTIPQVIITMN